MQYTGLISVVKTSIPGWHHFGSKFYTNIGTFKFLENCSRWKLEPKGTQKSMFYELSTPVWKMSTNVY